MIKPNSFVLKNLILVLSLLLMINCKNTEMKPPVAKKLPKELTLHGDTRIDNYYWMNDRENPEVISYLENENSYQEDVLKDTEGFQEELFKEIKGRIKEDDQSVPYKYNGYWYVKKFETGKEYPIYTRKKETLEAEEEILFDVNEMAKEYDYYSLTGVSISPDNKWAAFSVDTVGRRIYSIRFKNLETSEILETEIPNTSGSAVWADDNETIFYTIKDEALRPYKLMKHLLKSDFKKDEEIFTEENTSANIFVGKSKSRKYIILGSSTSTTDEYRILPADKPGEEFKLFQKRTAGLEYSLGHFKNVFYILTNKDGASNFKLMKTPEGKTTSENWTEVIPHRENVLLEGFELYDSHIILEERKEGLGKFRMMSWDGKEDEYLEFPEETYSISMGTNVDMADEEFRYGYTSLTTPSSVKTFNLKTKTTKLLKQQEVLDDDFSPENYVSERIWVEARDGKKVAVSIVKRKEIPKSEDTPLLLYAYGSYGYTLDPYFSSVRLSLLDRGFTYAIAHIRGSEYLGREWYEDGKFLNKKNTFNDFVDVSKHLIAKKYTSPSHLYAMGGSAGGLLMGAVINQAPELYNGVVAQVPFVDVLTTMLDEDIPLTTGEYEEWGNPNDKEYYDYMKSYSPYDQIKKQDYPNLLITSGLHDSQVQYWEPTKWAAKLREYNQSDNLLLLKTNMKAGHSGASGRFEALKEVALEYAFIFYLEGIEE